MERKSFPFELEEKGLDPEARTFKGYAAVTGILDDGGDIIDYGAFKNTLFYEANRVKVFYIHDFQEPIGKPLENEDGTVELKEVRKGSLPKKLREAYPAATGGLFVHAHLSETRRGNEVLTMMRDGVLDELSIGYKTIQEEMKEDGPDGQMVRHLKEIKLLDVSPVPLAMNPAAVVTDVKEFKVEETEDYIRVPVPGEEGKHEGHRIRTITISAEKGIKALYCGECKKNITYLFSKDKGWTVAKAVAWVKEHAKSAEDNIELKFAGSPRNRYGTHSSYKFKGNYAAAWRCHFSKVGGGGTSGGASGPIRGTVRRTEMIAAAMKPACKLPDTESIGPRSGPKSPLDCSFPSSPKDYGLSSWDKPEGDEERAKTQLSCSDLAVIKRAALAEIKRRANDRENGKGLEPEDVDETIDGDPLVEDLEALVSAEADWSGAERIDEAELNALMQRAEIQRQMIEAQLTQ